MGLGAAGSKGAEGPSQETTETSFCPGNAATDGSREENHAGRATTPEDAAEAGAGRPAGGRRTVGGSQLLPARGPCPLPDQQQLLWLRACPPLFPTEAWTGLTRLSAQRRVRQASVPAP